MVILVLLVVLFGSAGPLLGADASGSKTGSAVYPHVEKGHCDVCHIAAEDTLNSWFTFPSTKKQLKSDYNSLCRQCHGLDFGHGVGKHPTFNRAELPMDKDGKIACAITCHKMHIKSDDEKQTKYHLRHDQNTLCLSCHPK